RRPRRGEPPRVGDRILRGAQGGGDGRPRRRERAARRDRQHRARRRGQARRRVGAGAPPPPRARRARPPPPPPPPPRPPPPAPAAGPRRGIAHLHPRDARRPQGGDAVPQELPVAPEQAGGGVRPQAARPAAVGAAAPPHVRVHRRVPPAVPPRRADHVRRRG